MADQYPPVGFHFRVEFAALPTFTADMRFQEVSGIGSSISYTPVKEGGENRFAHSLPERPSYTNLVLKRGLTSSSMFNAWIEMALNQFQFVPAQLLVSLLNENSQPIYSWFFAGVLPEKWSTSDFNAKSNDVVIETLELRYKFFKRIS